MKVNIWSDIRCPFCYVGKHKFEAALQQFPHSKRVEVEWHSFQLDPNLKTAPELNIYDFLTDLKGISRQQAEEMNAHIRDIGRELGLDFNFDKVIIANSFNAHRLIQLAKTKGLGAEAEEQFFKAHFTDGKNIDERDTLVEVAKAIGLDEKEVNNVLDSDAFTAEVNKDALSAQSIGVRGVPFFVFNNKYGVSGAQPTAIFLQTLERAWAEFEKDSKQTLDLHS